jgi:hypothetical protein
MIAADPWGSKKCTAGMMDCVYLPPKWVASHPGIAAAPVA